MNRLSIVPLAAALSVLMLAGCTAGTAGTAKPSTSHPTANAIDEAGDLAGKKIVYVDAAPGNPLMDGIAQGLASELNRRGAKLVRAFQVNAQNQLDLAAGNQRINEALAQGVDAIVAFPLDANAIRPGVAAAKAAGVPIFIFQDLGGLDVTGKVAFPDEARGKATAEALAKELGNHGTATVLSGIPTDNIEAAVRGGVKGLTDNGLTLVGDPNNQRNIKDDAPEAMRVAQTIFQQHPNLDALLVYNSASATGAIAAAKQAGLEGKVRIATMAGDDTNIAQIKNGELSVSYDFNAPSYGATMAALVARGLTGEQLHGEIVQAEGGTAYTKDNVSDYVPWDQRIKYVDIPSAF